ncbi:hypothetical protein [Acrocarpospora sp. B8E8]|uniref:hypothetical protein n=1 Tax=Acrocarpospora sp. B8E8 TaxID=3153572 RepID=UPI00325DAA8E
MPDYHTTDTDRLHYYQRAGQFVTLSCVIGWIHLAAPMIQVPGPDGPRDLLALQLLNIPSLSLAAALVIAFTGATGLLAMATANQRSNVWPLLIIITGPASLISLGILRAMVNAADGLYARDLHGAFLLPLFMALTTMAAIPAYRRGTLNPIFHTRPTWHPDEAPVRAHDAFKQPWDTASPRTPHHPANGTAHDPAPAVPQPPATVTHSDTP